MNPLMELFGSAALELTAIGSAVVVIAILLTCVVRSGFGRKSTRCAADNGVFDRALIAEMVREQIRQRSRKTSGATGAENRKGGARAGAAPVRRCLPADSGAARRKPMTAKKRLVPDPYGKARRLADGGHRADRIAAHVGISRAEAELIVKLRRMVSGGGSNTEYPGQPVQTLGNAH